jgi:hypothetical protein
VQKLHLVGVTTERDGLILSARRGSKSGGYVLGVDEAVAAAVADAHERRGDADAAATDDRPPRAESLLSVKEVQARLRAGRTVEEVAAEAGVDPTWVERFAQPVRAEQTQVVADLRSATMQRPRVGASIEPVGSSVQRNLAERGLPLTEEEFDDGWSTYQLFEDKWMVEYRYVLRGRTHVVAWEYDVSSGDVVAADRPSAQLGYIATPGDEPRPAKRAAPRASARPSPRRAAANRGEASKRITAARKAAARKRADIAKRAEAAHKAEERRRAVESKRAETARKAEERRAVEAAKRAVAAAEAAERARRAEERRLASESRRRATEAEAARKAQAAVDAERRAARERSADERRAARAAARSSATKRAAARRPAAKKAGAKKAGGRPGARKAVAKKASAKRAVARKASTKKARPASTRTRKAAKTTGKKRAASRAASPPKRTPRREAPASPKPRMIARPRTPEAGEVSTATTRSNGGGAHFVRESDRPPSWPTDTASETRSDISWSPEAPAPKPVFRDDLVRPVVGDAPGGDRVIGRTAPTRATDGGRARRRRPLRAE